MTKFRNLPVALTIAGSDSGGGAGIQADLNVFAALDVHGTSAVTCLTAQNPLCVRGIQATKPSMVRSQIEAVFDEFQPAAIKTGMLYSAPVIKAVARCLRSRPCPSIVVDPVMVSTSGARLLRKNAIDSLQQFLFPIAALVTPNVDEAEILAGMPVRTVEDLRAAAREIHRRHGCSVLAKGGHLRGMREAVDLFNDGKVELLLKAPFIRGLGTHGTGCSYSAAIAAWLARGYDLAHAVVRAKEFVTHAINRSVKAGRHTVLGWRCGF